MSERRGVLSAGTWCVDFNKSIARWPDEDTSNEVLAIDRQGGGSGSTWRSTSSASIQIFRSRRWGSSATTISGAFSSMQCDAHGIDARRASRATGRRDDERRRLQRRVQRPAHPFLSSGRRRGDDARRLRLLFDAGADPASRTAGRAQGDGPARGAGDANGWVAVLAQGARRGACSQSRIDDDPRPSGLPSLAGPACPISIGSSSTTTKSARLPGGRRGARTVRPTWTRSPARSRACSRSAPCAGSPLTFLKGAVVGGRDGSRVGLGSVALPASAIVGANGAGDAFAAGMLYGLHEQWPIVEMSAARRTAARPRRCAQCRRRPASGRSPNASSLTKQWGFRPLALNA